MGDFYFFSAAKAGQVRQLFGSCSPMNMLSVCPGHVSAVFTLNFLIPIQVLGSLQEQREAIAELRSMIEYQVGLASLVLSFGLHSYIPLP